MPPRIALQKEIETNIELGEGLIESQLKLIAPTHDEQVVEFWRALLDMQISRAVSAWSGIGYWSRSCMRIRSGCCSALTAKVIELPGHHSPHSPLPHQANPSSRRGWKVGLEVAGNKK
jgi:hypothetical protein